MQGTVPGELGSAALLTQLLLTGNALTGALPSFISYHPALLTVSLGSNNFSGPIPSEWCGEGVSNTSRIDLSVSSP